MHSRPVRNHLRFRKTARYATVSTLATIPLVFGAVHPIVLGTYTAFMLVVFGGWLLLNSNQLPSRLFRSPWIYSILLIIGWIFLTTLPLPLSLLEILSPARASALQAVNQLGGANIHGAAIDYNSPAGQLFAFFLFALLLYARTLTVLLAADRTLLKTILYIAISVAIFEAIYGMMQVFNPELSVLWLSNGLTGKGMARGTIIYKNQYASLLNICWPLAVGAALLQLKKITPIQPPALQHTHTTRHKQSRSRRLAKQLNSDLLRGLFFLFLAAFIMMTVFFSQSRGGTIAMVIIMTCMLVLLPMKRKNKILLTSGLFLFAILYGSVVGFTAVINRFLVIGDSGLARINIYLASLPMLYDHLMTGIGIGAYELLSPVYLKHFPETVHFLQAHNEFLEFTIELGIPMALFVFSVLFIALARQGKQLYRYKIKQLGTVPGPIIIAIVSYCAIIGFLIHGTADFGWHLPANLLYAVTLCVLITHGLNSTTPRHPSTSHPGSKPRP